VPFSILMLTLSSRSGRLATRYGPRAQMTIGPLVVAAGLVLFGRVNPGAHYVTVVLPAVLIMGLGMAITVAPLTAAVLAEIDDEFTGIASGVNNAVSRLAGLLAVAALPVLAGVSAGASLQDGLRQGYVTAMHICAALCVVGGVVAFATIRKLATSVHPRQHCRSC
jgi:MFS family permease